MKNDTPRTEVTDETVNLIAARADVDPRTVVRRLAHLPVRGRVGVRVDRAIADVLSHGSLGKTGTDP